MQSFSLVSVLRHWEHILSAQTAKDSSLKKVCRFFKRASSHCCSQSSSLHIQPSHSIQHTLQVITHTQLAASNDYPAKARHHGNCSFPWSDHFIVCEPCQCILAFSLSLCLFLSSFLYFSLSLAFPVHTVPASALPAQTNTAQPDVNSHSNSGAVGKLHR